MSTLIIPFVSAGNVPQLCTDLLLHSLREEFRFIKELNSKWLHAFLGPLDYADKNDNPLYSGSPSKRYTTPLELFYNKKRDTYVIQQRSPVFEGHENEFCKQVLVPLIQELAPKRVLILDSISPFESNVPVSSNTESRFSVGTCAVSSIDDVAREFAEGLHISKEGELSVNKNLFSFTAQSFQDGISTEQFIFKFIYHLLNSVVPMSSSLDSVIYIAMSINEGDNNQDAQLMCEMLPQLWDGFPKITKFTAPVSWNGVYGSRPIPDGYDEGLYV
ncbi:HFL286Cp [Eremothecium sinecaudum]|uniref:Proteasome assembly chaperone 2 n=1 Tax=Eremothecium sinecaudum TaxID=45286 RepID=A0A109UZK3_9SACH|nr:HFL286Cp [Eremothecium sinecaudum]AMD21570.1 HFL286Cp [Eremothecium sinecaudum]